jgi:hypothetical protein
MRISHLDQLRDEVLDLAIALGEASFEIGDVSHRGSRPDLPYTERYQ